jgi:hypothetical protein
MGSNLKNFYNFIFLLIITSISTLQANYTESVIVDSPDYTVETQFQAIFFKPTTNNLYYAAEAFPFNTSIASPILSPNWQIFDLHPKYHFGFDLGIRGIIHSRSTTFAINLVHFSSHTSSCQTAVGNNMVGPFSSIGPDASPYKTAQGDVKFTFNEFTINCGQLVNFGEFLQTNLFAGISVDQIKQCLYTNYANTTESVSRATTVPSSFIGAGPQCGLDFNYNIVRRFNFAGHLAMALLLGPTKNHTIYSSSSPLITAAENPSPNIQSTCVENRAQMVPSFDESLGFAYSFTVHDRQIIRFEVGYRAKVFINAIQSTDLSSGVTDVTPDDNTVGVFARTFARTLGNFSLGGPYIAFDIAF